MPVTRIKSDLLGVDFKVRSDGELNSRDYFDILKEVGPDGQQIVSPQDLLHVYKSAPYDERRQKLAINALDNGFFESEGSFTEAMTHMGASVGRGIGKSVTTNLFGTSRLLKGQLDYGEPEDDTPQSPLVEQGILKAAQQLRGLSYAAKRSDRSFDQDLDSAMRFAGIDRKNDTLKKRVIAEARLQDYSQSDATLAQAGFEASAMPATMGAKGAEWAKQIGTFDDDKEKLATIDYLAEQFDITDKIEQGAELGLAQGGALATLANVYGAPFGLGVDSEVNEKALADVQAGRVQPDRDVAMAASFAMMPDMWASMGAGAGVNLGLRSISRGTIMKAAQAASEESALKANISFWKGASGYAPGSVEKIIGSAEQKLAKVAGSQERLNKLVAKSEGIAQSLSAKLASAGQGESSQAARLLQAIEKAPDPKAPLINRAVGKALQGTGYTVEQVGRAGELLRRLPEETLTTLFMRSGGMDEASARAIARTVQVAVAAGTLTGGFQDLDPNLAQLATALLLTPGGPSMITRLGHDVGILGKQLQFAQASSPLFQRIAQLEPAEASFVEASLDRTAAMTLPETVGGLAQKIFSPTRQFGPSVALKAPSTFLSRTGLGNTLTGAVNTAKTAAGAAAIPGAFGYALGGEEGAGGAIGASWPFIAAGMGAGTLMRFGSMADVHAKMLGDRAVYKETLSPVDLVEFESYTKPVQQALATTAVQNPDVIVNFKKGNKSSYYAQENGESVITLYDGSTAAEQLSAVLGHEIAHHIDTFGFMPYVIEELLGSVEKKKPGVYTEYGKDGKPIVIKDEAGNNVYATNDEFAIRRKQYLDRLEPGSEAYNRYANNDALIAREVFASHGAAWYFGGEFVKKNWQGAGSKMMGAILDPIFGSNGMRKFLHRIGIPTNEGTKLVADPTYGGKGLMPGLKEVPALVRMIEKYNADVRGYGAEARRQGRGRGNLVDPAFKDEVAGVSLTAKDLENPAIVERLKAGGHVKIADDGSIEVDASGRPVFLPTREVNKNNKQLSNDILDIIQKKEDAGETFGEGHVAMVETADGKPRATGRFLDPSIIAELRKQNRYNQHQLDALARINATLRNDTGDVWNLFYYSALKYNKAGRKVYGQIKGGDRPSLPFGIEITKDGNVIISTISLDAIQKNLEWFAKSKGYRQKMFDEFGGNNANEIVRNALSLLPQYLENHRKGKTDPAFENGKPASGISEGQRDLLNAAIGKINAEQVKRNPILEGLGDRRSNRQQSYRSRRLDRIGNAVRGEDGYYASTSRIERNLQPMRMPRRKPVQPDDTIPLPFDELPGDKPGEGFGRMINVDKTKAEMAEAKRLADEAQDGFSSSGNVRSKDAYGRDKLFMPAAEAGALKGKQAEAAKLWQEKGTDSPVFKKWFGRSKVVNENGEPRVMQHGTGQEFEVFKRRPGADFGFHFGTMEQATARILDKFPYATKENVQNLIVDGKAHILPVYLSIEKPLRIPDTGQFQSSNWDFINALSDHGITIKYGSSSPTVARKIKKAGYDGLVYANRHEGTGDSYVALESSQAKSAFPAPVGNRGTFDAGDPNMLFMPAAKPVEALSDANLRALEGDKKAVQTTLSIKDYTPNPDPESVALTARAGIVNPNISGMPKTYQGVRDLVTRVVDKVVHMATTYPTFAKRTASFYSDMARTAVNMADVVKHQTRNLFDVADLQLRFLALGSPRSAVAANQTKSSRSIMAAHGHTAGHKINPGDQQAGANRTTKDWDAGKHFDVLDEKALGADDKVRNFYLNGLAELIEVARVDGTAKDVAMLQDRAARTLGLIKGKQKLTSKKTAELERLLEGLATVDMWDMAGKEYAHPAYVLKGKGRGTNQDTAFHWSIPKHRVRATMKTGSTAHWSKALRELGKSSPEELSFREANALQIDGKKNWNENTWASRIEKGFNSETEWSYYTKADEGGLTPGGGGPLYDAHQTIDGLIADRLNGLGLATFFGKKKLFARNAQEIIWALTKFENPLPANQKLVLFGDRFAEFHTAIENLRRTGVVDSKLPASARSIFAAIDDTYAKTATQSIPFEVVSQGKSPEAIASQKAETAMGAEDFTSSVAENLGKELQDIIDFHGEDVSIESVKVGRGGYTEDGKVAVSPNIVVALRGEPAITKQIMVEISRAGDQAEGNVIRKPTLQDLNSGRRLNAALTFDTSNQTPKQQAAFFLALNKLKDAKGERFLTGYTETADGMFIGDQYYGGDMAAEIAKQLPAIEAIRKKYNAGKGELNKVVVDAFKRPDKVPFWNVDRTSFSRDVNDLIRQKISTAQGRKHTGLPQVTDRIQRIVDRADKMGRREYESAKKREDALVELQSEVDLAALDGLIDKAEKGNLKETVKSSFSNATIKGPFAPTRRAIQKGIESRLGDKKTTAKQKKNLLWSRRPKGEFGPGGKELTPGAFEKRAKGLMTQGQKSADLLPSRFRAKSGVKLPRSFSKPSQTGRVK